MANRAKEDEKNEKIIRGLLKLSENRRCINCNSLGPQYVCLNFWTFVCTTCSGIHREFTHRVKSISMAKFTSQEVAALQGGGNQRAREFYFKEWESQHQTAPDSSNVDRLRDFIKHVYVDKKYSGERSLSKPPRAKEGDKEDMYENKIMDGSRSSYDSYDRSYSGRNSPGGRSDNKNFRDSYDGKNPGYEQGNQQYDTHRSPTRPQVVNDWRREDRFGSGDSKLEGRSPDRQKDISSPPIIRPVRDILKENVSLRVIEPPKSNPSKITDGFSQQRTASSSSFGSADKIFVEPKKNLIDFDAEPDIPPAQQAQQTTGILPISQSEASSTSENWASFDFAAEPKAPQAPAPVNTLESVLSQLSVSSPVPVQVSDNSSGGDTMTRALVGGTSSAPPLGYTSTTAFSSSLPAAAPGNNFSAFPPVSTSVGSPTSAPILPINDVGQWPSVQHQQHTLFYSTGNQLAAHQFTPVGGALSNQQWNSSLPSSAQVLTTVLPASQAILKQGQETNSVVTSQSPLLQVNSGGRKELPEDLFAAYYSPAPVPRPGWQMGPPVGMGPTMQYHNIVAIPTNPQSSNPFDLNVQTLHTSASAPSMASLHGAFSNLPHPASANLLRTSSLGSSSPYTAVLPPQTPSYVSAVPPRAYIGQQAQSNMFAVRHQGLADYGNMGPAFSPLDPNPQLAGQYSAPAGGNPFA